MLTDLILKTFVPSMKEKPDAAERTRCGVLSGIVGIVCNVILAIVKLVLAVISGSIAMGADAVNNLSDAGSGVITVAGFRLSSRPPDAEHPFGHGRTEYVAALVVALLIVGLGFTFLKDSFVAIFRPGKLSADPIMILIFSCTVLVKCFLFFFYKKVAKLIDSDVIRAPAYDSLSDCLGTFVVIVSLILNLYIDFPVDGCAGVIVACLILWAGIGVLKDTVSKLLGESPDHNLVKELREKLLACPGIDGVHDIIIHNYGENSYYVTAHAEISSEGDRFSAHDILENAEVEVARTMPVHLLLHGDPYSKEDPDVIYWRSRLENTIAEYHSEFKVYDFRLMKAENNKVKSLSFHLLIPRDYAVPREEIHSFLQEQMKKFDPALKLDIQFLFSYV